MPSAKHTGRIIGVLLLVYMATGLIVPYVFTRPLSTGPFLESAAAMSSQIRFMALLLFVGAALPVGIAVAGWPVIRQHSNALGLWLLVLAAVNLALQGVENIHSLTMLSMSEAYVEAGAANAGYLESLGLAVRSARRWAHYSHLLFAVLWLSLLFILLYRRALVPRPLAAFGVFTTLLQLGGITLPVFVGFRVQSPELYGMPLGVAMLVTALWLMVSGFREPPVAFRPEAHGVEVSGA